MAAPRRRYQHLFEPKPDAEACESSEVIALIEGDIVYAWRCCLGVGRVRELGIDAVADAGDAGIGDEPVLDLEGLRRELAVWGHGLRSTMLFDDAIAFQLTVNLAHCSSDEVRSMLEALKAELTAFHRSMGDLQPLTSPFEVAERWAAGEAAGLPIVFLGGHRAVKDFVERHPSMKCFVVSDCRKRGDFSYGKTIPEEAFAVVNAVYRTKCIQLTRLRAFMERHNGQVRAILNYDPNIVVREDESSYFTCYEEKRELALDFHGLLAKRPPSTPLSLLRPSAHWCAQRAARAAALAALAAAAAGDGRQLLSARGRRRKAAGARLLVALLALFSQLLLASSLRRARRVADVGFWLRHFAAGAAARALNATPLATAAPEAWLLLGVLLRASAAALGGGRGGGGGGEKRRRGGGAAALLLRRLWTASEVGRAAVMLAQAVAIRRSYGPLIKGIQQHYERTLRASGQPVALLRHPAAPPCSGRGRGPAGGK